MTTRVKKRGSLSLTEILEAVKSLTPDDQARLREELASLTQVYVLKPDERPDANQRGQDLADKLRDELRSSVTGDLDQAMSQLRGRMWSS